MKNILLLLLLIFSEYVQATAQAPDLLFYDGKELELQVNPLDEYFEKNPNKRVKNDFVSSGNWRGYIAKFEFKENIFTIKEMFTEHWGNNGVERKSVLEKVFPNSSERELTWYSGLLVLPRDELKDYVHSGYAEEYENYILLKVINGKLIKASNFSLKDYREFKYKMFQLYKQTKEYESQYKKFSKEMNTSEAESFIYQVINFYPYINVEL